MRDVTWNGFGQYFTAFDFYMSMFRMTSRAPKRKIFFWFRIALCHILAKFVMILKGSTNLVVLWPSKDLNPAIADHLAGHNIMSHIFCYFCLFFAFVLIVVITASESKRRW